MKAVQLLLKKENTLVDFHYRSPLPTTYDIYNTLTSSLFKYIPLDSRHFIDKITILEMIKAVDEKISTYCSCIYKNRNLLHLAVCYGDTDILLAILEKEGVDDLLYNVDMDNKTPLELAIEQGVPLNAIIVFLASLKYCYQKINQEITLEYFCELRKTETDSERILNIAIHLAQHTFYVFIQDQLHECLQQINPVDQVYGEKIITNLSVLAKDFLHESWIGAPDSATPAYEIAGLESKEEIEDFILDWCETNPVAAMRCYYVYCVLDK